MPRVIRNSPRPLTANLVKGVGCVVGKIQAYHSVRDHFKQHLVYSDNECYGLGMLIQMLQKMKGSHIKTKKERKANYMCVVRFEMEMTTASLLTPPNNTFAATSQLP